MFQMMGVFAEFERAIIRERVPVWPRPGQGGRRHARAPVARGQRCRQGKAIKAAISAGMGIPAHCPRAQGWCRDRVAGEGGDGDLAGRRVPSRPFTGWVHGGGAKVKQPRELDDRASGRAPCLPQSGTRHMLCTRMHASPAIRQILMFFELRASVARSHSSTAAAEL
jgi:hypothetical protein